MRFISADYIFPISSAPIPKGIVAIDEYGEIIAVYDAITAAGNILHADIEYYKGIICPGFINTHCHLELSHLKGVISQGGGLPTFIKEIISKRGSIGDAEVIAQAIANAEQEMINNGIVAVGDINNTTDTLPQKAKGNLIYYSFIELFDLYNSSKTHLLFEEGKQLKKQFDKAQELLPDAYTSIVPHASYSVSPDLFNLIVDTGKNNVISIHNQETASENELFISKSGELIDTLNNMGVDMNLFKPTGVNAVKSILPYTIKLNKLLLVHNTYTTAADILWINNYYKQNNSSTKLYWVTCPNANLYIENKLPDYTAFINNKATVTIGTDSYSSNWSLSILDELKTIHRQYPDIELQTLLTWATINGAQALELAATLGTIEKGKKPGLNLITTTDQFHLYNGSSVTKLI